MNAVHYSSASDEWPTPQDFFDRLNKESTSRLTHALHMRMQNVSDTSPKKMMDLRRIGRPIQYL